MSCRACIAGRGRSDACVGVVRDAHALPINNDRLRVLGGRRKETTIGESVEKWL